MTGASKPEKARAWLESVATALDLPASKYEAAERSYHSLAEWIDRAESQLADSDVSVYLQGSFRLGTAIAPIHSDEYDLDVVCEVDWPKDRRTQEQLHDTLGEEIRAYAQRYGMQEPSEWDRCWTLHYAEDARFHMDVLPCVPDALRQRLLREEASVSLAHVEEAVSITDRTHPMYRHMTPEWPASNPNGYADWFLDQMRTTFNARREYLCLMEAKVSVADVPEFRVRTPLQYAIQVLKRHRDLYFWGGDTDGKPTSIVITTLSALAYQQESTVADALGRILETMDQFIQQDADGRYWIPNPADPRENFADAWHNDQNKPAAFQEWLAAARADFARALASDSPTEFAEALAPRLGRSLVESALPSRVSNVVSGLAAAGTSMLQRLRNAPHRRAVRWRVATGGQVALNAQFLRKGFRPQPLVSNGAALPQGCTLTFTATTSVAGPYDVYWQIINTGEAAGAAGDLRGDFERSRTEHGHLTRREDTKYPGTHSIECFIVKQGFCIARSGMFIVHVA